MLIINNNNNIIEKKSLSYSSFIEQYDYKPVVHVFVWAAMSKMLFVNIFFFSVSFIYIDCIFDTLLNCLFFFLCSIDRARLKFILYSVFVNWFELCFLLLLFFFLFICIVFLVIMSDKNWSTTKIQISSRFIVFLLFVF
jgi:hypothetical protein